jgi:hypothetical protein
LSSIWQRLEPRSTGERDIAARHARTPYLKGMEIGWTQSIDRLEMLLARSA